MPETRIKKLSELVEDTRLYALLRMGSDGRAESVPKATDDDAYILEPNPNIVVVYASRTMLESVDSDVISKVGASVIARTEGYCSIVGKLGHELSENIELFNSGGLNALKVGSLLVCARRNSDRMYDAIIGTNATAGDASYPYGADGSIQAYAFQVNETTTDDPLFCKDCGHVHATLTTVAHRVYIAETAAINAGYKLMPIYGSNAGIGFPVGAAGCNNLAASPEEIELLAQYSKIASGNDHGGEKMPFSAWANSVNGIKPQYHADYGFTCQVVGCNTKLTPETRTLIKHRTKTMCLCEEHASGVHKSLLDIDLYNSK